MDLKLIPNETCPDCGSHIVAEYCESDHANGRGFEERRFACGCVLAWIPSLEKLKVTNICPHNKEHIEANNKVLYLKNKLYSIIGESDIDEMSKERLISHIKNT